MYVLAFAGRMGQHVADLRADHNTLSTFTDALREAMSDRASLCRRIAPASLHGWQDSGFSATASRTKRKTAVRQHAPDAWAAELSPSARNCRIKDSRTAMYRTLVNDRLIGLTTCAKLGDCRRTHIKSRYGYRGSIQSPPTSLTSHTFLFRRRCPQIFPCSR